MKYSNTARVLSFVFHLILVLAFGVLGFYFGFFVVPEYFDATIRPNFINDVIAGYPLDLVIELAVLGLSIFTISLYGLVNGIKSLLNPSDDKPVVKSFVAFIGDGYVASIFFAACAFLYFDPIANKNMAFAIVMCVLLMTNEEFGKRLNSIHNIRFLIKMMEGAREAIKEDRFKEYKEEIIAKYGDERGF